MKIQYKMYNLKLSLLIDYKLQFKALNFSFLMRFVSWRQSTLSVTESTRWMHTVQIGVGLIILFLSIIVLFNPIIGNVPVVFFLALVLLFAGIEKVIIGFNPSGKSHLISIGLGIIVIVVALIAMTYPTGTSIFIVMLFGIALLIDGIFQNCLYFRRKSNQRDVEIIWYWGRNAFNNICTGDYVISSYRFGCCRSIYWHFVICNKYTNHFRWNDLEYREENMPH